MKRNETSPSRLLLRTGTAHSSRSPLFFFDAIDGSWRPLEVKSYGAHQFSLLQTGPNGLYFFVRQSWTLPGLGLCFVVDPRELRFGWSLLLREITKVDCIVRNVCGHLFQSNSAMDVMATSNPK